MKLEFLLVTGPDAPDALVSFNPGLNVINGGSNTGKSHILRLIDYVLGAKDPPEPIIEQATYDLVQLGISCDDGKQRTLIRALQGGDIRVVDGLVHERITEPVGTIVKAKHGKNSLSKLLLESLGVVDARIRQNAEGKTRELSFRDLVHHVLIDEAKIQMALSPILSGQYMHKTAEISVFKYLLSGVDDSALELAKPDTGQAAQLELIDRQIREAEREIAESEQDAEELLRLDSELDAHLAGVFDEQERTEVSFRIYTSQRRDLRREHERCLDRIGEIETLEGRFQLLSQHYASDMNRLAAISEAGEFFMLEEAVVCPVCGSAPASHRPEAACDGNVAQITRASIAEATDLQRKRGELAQTIQALVVERQGLEAFARTLASQLEQLDLDIARESPSVQYIRAEAKRFIQQKVGVGKSLAVVKRLQRLLTERKDLGISPGYDSSTVVAQQQLDGGLLNQFCLAVEEELQAWDFPGAERVFFDLQKMDISVAGKPRSANGKGVRALLHGAFSVGLMNYCRKKARAHPGFVVLDSLFITYRDPDDVESVQIASTPLKDRALQHFAGLSGELQLIILDNVDVPDWLSKDERCVHFTGRESQGRAGLFPA